MAFERISGGADLWNLMIDYDHDGKRKTTVCNRMCPMEGFNIFKTFTGEEVRQIGDCKNVVNTIHTYKRLDGSFRIVDRITFLF